MARILSLDNISVVKLDVLYKTKEGGFDIFYSA